MRHLKHRITTTSPPRMSNQDKMDFFLGWFGRLYAVRSLNFENIHSTRRATLRVGVKGRLFFRIIHSNVELTVVVMATNQFRVDNYRIL